MRKNGKKQSNHDQSKKSFVWVRLIALVFVGIVVGLLASYLTEKFDIGILPRVQTIFLLLLVGIIVGAWLQYLPINRIPVIIAILYILSIGPILYFTRVRCNCSYEGETTANTLINLIHEESKAAIIADISIIKRIFSEPAKITKVSTGESWEDPITYYSLLFHNYTFTKAVHYDIRVIHISKDAARLVSANAGKFYPNKNPKKIQSYEHAENEDDEWTFGKNDCGCWVITGFKFY